jgi:hypothetical protein
MGPSLETGAVFECCTVGELLRDCDPVSVMAGQEKGDEKDRNVGSEKPMRETDVESHPFRKVREEDGAPGYNHGR